MHDMWVKGLLKRNLLSNVMALDSSRRAREKDEIQKEKERVGGISMYLYRMASVSEETGGRKGGLSWVRRSWTMNGMKLRKDLNPNLKISWNIRNCPWYEHSPVCYTLLRSPSTCTQRRDWRRCPLLRAHWPPAPFPPSLELRLPVSWPPLDRSSLPALHDNTGTKKSVLRHWSRR